MLEWWSHASSWILFQSQIHCSPNLGSLRGFITLLKTCLVSSENRIRKLTLVLGRGNFVELPCWRVSKSFYQFPMSVRGPCLDRSNVVGAGTADSSADTNHQATAVARAKMVFVKPCVPWTWGWPLKKGTCPRIIWTLSDPATCASDFIAFWLPPCADSQVWAAPDVGQLIQPA